MAPCKAKEDPKAETEPRAGRAIEALELGWTDPAQRDADRQSRGRRGQSPAQGTRRSHLCPGSHRGRKPGAQHKAGRSGRAPRDRQALPEEGKRGGRSLFHTAVGREGHLQGLGLSRDLIPGLADP